MRENHFKAYCSRCRHEQLFVGVHINHWAQLGLTIVTFGLWLVSWAALWIGKFLRPHRCIHCGWHHPEFRHSGVED